MTGEEVRESLRSDDKGILLNTPHSGNLNIAPLGGRRIVACIPLTSEEYLTDKIAEKSWFDNRVALAKSLLIKYGSFPQIMFFHIIEPIQRGAWTWKSAYQRRQSPRTL